MLYVRKELQNDLVVLYVDRDVILQTGVIFADGNAASERIRFFSDIADLSRLDWDCLRAAYWTEFPEGSRKRCAEVLVPESVPADWIRRVVTKTDSLRDELISEGYPWQVEAKPDWFF